MACRQCNFGLCEGCHGEPLDEDLQIESAESVEVLANLCGLGFSYREAKQALNAANGDADQAASLLLATAGTDIDAESQVSELHGRADPIIID
jgi:hypothetical protein